jgi:hypothetical protein
MPYSLVLMSFTACADLCADEVSLFYLIFSGVILCDVYICMCYVSSLCDLCIFCVVLS